MLTLPLPICCLLVELQELRWWQLLFGAGALKRWLGLGGGVLAGPLVGHAPVTDALKAQLGELRWKIVLSLTAALLGVFAMRHVMPQAPLRLSIILALLVACVALLGSFREVVEAAPKDREALGQIVAGLDTSWTDAHTLAGQQPVQRLQLAAQAITACAHSAWQRLRAQQDQLG